MLACWGFPVQINQCSEYPTFTPPLPQLKAPMELTINLDLPSIISAAVSTERLQPLVDRAIMEALKSAIDDATGYSSQFRKAVKEQLAQAMPHGLGIDDVVKFQHMFNSALAASVHTANNETIQLAMRKAMASVIPEVPTSITLSELMDEVRKGFHKDDFDEFFAELELSQYGGGWLYLDSDSSCTRTYSASTRLAFTKDGEVYA